MPPAGLSSGEAHIAHDRGHPTKEALDYSELPIQRAKSVVLPAVPVSMNYTNEDIPFSHPSATPLTSCYGLPRTFKAGSRCVNPLEPRYVLPGASAYANKPAAGSAAATAAAGGAGAGAAAGLDSPGAAGGAALPSPSRTASGTERLLPAVSLPRSAGGADAAAAAAASPKAPHSALASPLPPASPSNGAAAAAAGSPLSPNPHVTTNGAVGGLLLYGPGTGPGTGTGAAAAASNSPSAAAIAAAAEASRCLNVADINGPRRSTSTPPRRAGAAGGGYDPLHVSDIVSPARRRGGGPAPGSPTRHLSSLTTSDIRGATVRARTRDAASPGRGTLNSADIAGAAPGCLTRASPTTFALGRWPAPAVPQYQFPLATRVTMLKMPPNTMT